MAQKSLPTRELAKLPGSDRLKKMQEQHAQAVEALENEIRIRQQTINEQKKELARKEADLGKLRMSAAPILLFLVDTTMDMPHDMHDYEHRGYYYFPEVDRVEERWYRRCYAKDAQLLPGTIDWRVRYQHLGMPNRVWPISPLDVKDEHGVQIIAAAVRQARREVRRIMTTTQVATWAGLAQKLRELPAEQKAPPST